eukprot:CAMPEP_0206051582 /NCGR_PEP_ID=MMETSP1466-20131121/31807_1 /ASSEMBLY_ACC=CAM_ASM_001126 /TAXON_ID=44452 /ORGANISM="Pavlova gyrans, Strain CCMP608" /LENGTH=334 /DNA_ID=CAMNT_0053426711 /DNA_START=16 /DNA_END=1020 /DNA_ORIENTATION=+
MSMIPIAPVEQSMERDGKLEREGPRPLIRLDLLGGVLSFEDEHYVLDPTPKDGKPSWVPDVCRLICRSYPFTYVPVADDDGPYLEYSHPHPCCFCLGCPPGSWWQTGRKYTLREVTKSKAANEAKRRLARTRHDICLRPLCYTCCSTCYSGVIKTLAIYDDAGAETFSLQRQIHPCMYCGASWCGPCYKCKEDFDLCAVLGTGRQLATYNTPVYKESLDTKNRVLVGYLSTRYPITPNSCCAASTVPLAIDTVFTPTAAHADKLTKDDLKSLSILVVNSPGQLIPCCLNEFTAPLDTPMGYSFLDLGLQYGDRPLVEYASFKDYVKSHLHRFRA